MDTTTPSAQGDDPIGEDAANGAIGERESFEAMPTTAATIAPGLVDRWLDARGGKMDEAAYGAAVNLATFAYLAGINKARASLTAEKVAQAEPVAWLTRWPNGTCEIDMDKDRAFAEAAIYRTKPVPLYAAPPAQTERALTDREVLAYLEPIADKTRNSQADVIRVGRSLLTAAQPASGGKS